MSKRPRPPEETSLHVPGVKDEGSESSLRETAAHSASDTGTDPPLTVGDVNLPEEFGRYRVKKQLGRGGMACVFLAEDTELDREVALKVPSFTQASSPEMVERFYREARSAAALRHPNICAIYDIGQHEGINFISMDYVQGRSLADYAASGKRQPERQVALVVRKVALALEEAHSKGLIHRDLKPANIMLDRRGEPIVMDFGLARSFANLEETRLTREGSLVGSPAYMSPEQLEGDQDLGPATDIYSLGVVLYELLTGRLPFEGGMASVIGQIIHVDAPSVSTVRSGASPELDAICQRAMAKSPEDRFDSMAEFAQALTDFIKGTTTQTVTIEKESPRRPAPLTADRPAPAAPVASPPRPVTTSNPKSFPIWLVAGGVGGLVLMVALVSGFSWLLRNAGPPPPEETGLVEAIAAQTGRPPRQDPPAQPPPSPFDNDPGGPNPFRPNDNDPRPPRPGESPFEGPPGPGNRGFGDMQNLIATPSEEIFAEYDRNQDGTLDPSEFPRHIIRRADQDFDDALTLSELEQSRKVQNKELFAPPQELSGPSPRPGLDFPSRDGKDGPPRPGKNGPPPFEREGRPRRPPP